MPEESKEIQKTTKRHTETSQKKTASYRSIFKATSLFGGVQVYQILIEIIKSKFIAVLLGPLGVGVQGLYTSAINLIQQLTSFGLSSSAVRNVAEANATGDKVLIARVIYSLRRLVWLTGLLGMIAVILLSPLLSKSSFGDSSHIVPFIIISVTLLFNQLSSGQKVILQGTRRLKLLARSTTIGVTIGLVISVPLYYWLRIKGIVPIIMISSLVALILTTYYSNKVHIEKVVLKNKEVLNIGRTMLLMGIAMSLSHLMSSANAYVIRAFIRNLEGVEAVGLFTAGFVLMSQYTGLVFNAMGTDYYPRLSAVNHDNDKCREMMNQQGEIGMLIIAPLMVFCVVFIPIIVKILYSDKFLPINGYIIWCSIGMLFKMTSWSISYVFVAKAESKLFIINEMSSALYTLIFNIIGYKIAGLQGIGISFAFSYFIYLLQLYIIAHKKYSFSFTNDYLKIFVIHFVLQSACVVCVVLFSPFLKYFWGTIILLLSVFFSFYELNKRIGLKGLVKKIKRKN